MERKKIVEALRELLTDEFDSSELVYLTENELIQKIIDCALYYKNQNQLILKYYVTQLENKGN